MMKEILKNQETLRIGDIIYFWIIAWEFLSDTGAPIKGSIFIDNP